MAKQITFLPLILLTDLIGTAWWKNNPLCSSILPSSPEREDTQLSHAVHYCNDLLYLSLISWLGKVPGQWRLTIEYNCRSPLSLSRPSLEKLPQGSLFQTWRWLCFERQRWLSSWLLRILTKSRGVSSQHSLATGSKTKLVQCNSFIVAPNKKGTMLICKNGCLTGLYTYFWKELYIVESQSPVTADSEGVERETNSSRK